MNWLKRLWNWLVRKTSTAPKLAVVVEEVVDNEEPVDVVFIRVCKSAGVKSRDLESTNAASLFKEWYTGKGYEADVLEAIPQFLKETGGSVSAKLCHRFMK